jgi:hypothetical protein
LTTRLNLDSFTKKVKQQVKNMENKLLEEQSAISSMAKKFNLNNIFVPAFLIFAAIAIFVVGYIINVRSLTNTYDPYSYFFVAASFALFLKIFVATYANSLYALAKKKWFLLAFNLGFFAIQLFLGGYAGYVLTESTYILFPLQFLLISGGLFYFQNLIDNNFKILDLSLVGAGLYLSLFLLTFYRFFDSDTRFWNAAGLISLVIEVVLFFVATRKFLKVIS